MKKAYLFACVTALLFAFFFFVYTIDVPTLFAPQPSITIGGATVVVEVARTSAEKEKGLSGRVSLPEGKGMLFLFDRPDRYGFWMPDMHFSIDIVWIGADWRIVDIAKEIPPESYPDVVVSDVDAQYVLEVPAGSIERYGWNVGDETEFATY